MAAIFWENCHMVDKAASAVMTAKDGTDDFAVYYCDLRHIGITIKVEGYIFSVIRV